MSAPAIASKLRLGDVLVAQKLISKEQLGMALEQQKRSGRRLGRVLVENGFCTDEQIAEAVARQLGVPYVNLKFYNLNNEVVRRLPESQARRFRAVVLEDRRTKYLVGMADPSDLFASDELQRSLKRDIEVAAVSEEQLLQTIDRIYRRTEEISGLAKELQQDIGDAYVDFGALGAAAGTCGTLIAFNILKQAGLRLGTGISLFHWHYLRVYLVITLCALGLLALEGLGSPSATLSFALAGVACLLVVGLNRKALNVGKTFPELMRFSLAKRFFGE